MINILKDNMNENDYQAFLIDYNSLYKQKNDKKLWRLSMSSKKGSVPYIKEFFDTLGNKFNYIAYRNSVQSNKDIFYLIIGYYQINRNSDDIKECLRLHYTIETYIAFMVEWILFNEIKANTNFRVYQNKILDTEKKADLLCNSIYYQIKNKSFIYDSDNTGSLIEAYRKANNRLFFIFYTIEEDNIYICAVNNKPFMFIDEIDDFTFVYNYGLINIKDFIKYLK